MSLHLLAPNEGLTSGATLVSPTFDDFDSAYLFASQINIDDARLYLVHNFLGWRVYDLTDTEVTA